ncbi:MAG TPA: hypothetical protein PKK12_00600 [Candidatus Aminicenantes bacterium]|nr:hypothetical protein [Candidatus Aminicenantes bacterium]
MTPAVTLPEALSLADRFLSQNRFDTAHHFLKSIELVDVGQVKKWRVTWEPRVPTDDDQLVLSVAMDRSVVMSRTEALPLPAEWRNLLPTEGEPREQRRSGSLFPDIPEGHSQAFHLRVIEAYCRQRGLRRLGREQVRLFVQPMGYVEMAVEIDLMNRLLTIHPGTHERGKTVRTHLTREQSAQLRALVTAEEFRRIPSVNHLMGADGCAWLIEASVEPAYSFKLHWQPTDEGFRAAVNQILALTQTAPIEKWE